MTLLYFLCHGTKPAVLLELYLSKCCILYLYQTHFFVCILALRNVRINLILMKCPNFISAMNIAANPIRCLLSASLAMYSNRESANLSTADKSLPTASQSNKCYFIEQRFKIN